MQIISLSCPSSGRVITELASGRWPGGRFRQVLYEGYGICAHAANQEIHPATGAMATSDAGELF